MTGQATCPSGDHAVFTERSEAVLKREPHTFRRSAAFRRRRMAELKEVDPALVLALREKLIDPNTDITERWEGKTGEGFMHDLII